VKGKTVLITGANRGIGRATALALADQGAKLVLVCRNEEQGRAVVAEIQERGAEAELILADLRSMPQVRAAAQAFKAGHDELHVLINNAGAVFDERRITEDRVEQTFAVNHLAHFLMTVELLDLLRASAPARIINVSSESHRRGWMRWHDLHFKADYKPQRAYAQAKLSTLLFTCELARRLAGSGVTANCLHPGSASRGFGPPEGGWAAFVGRITKPFVASAPEEDAKTAIYLASSPDVAAVSGKYFIKCAPVRPSGYGRDDGLARRIWTTSEMLLGMRAADAA
jgi:NAD(P)-dependent dehydrogenase (short-subunit alcohol dehydrogenase family)